MQTVPLLIYRVPQGIDVLQPPSQIMQPPQQPPRVLKRTENLYSFISAGSSTPFSPSPPSFSINARDNSGGGDSTSLDSSAEATAVVSVSSAPSNQAPAAVSTSSMPNPNPNSFDHVDWEAGILLGVQELDETTLRMEMRTSMDIHRLMRSRQKVGAVMLLVENMRLIFSMKPFSTMRGNYDPTRRTFC